MRKQGRLALFVALSALAAVPVAASGATRKMTGKTSQGEPVIVRVNDQGAVKFLKFKWEADCRERNMIWRDKMYFWDRQPKPFKRNGTHFSDGGKFRKRYREGPAVFNTKMTGRPSPQGGFRGTFRVSVRAYNRDGQRTDFCKTPLLRWSVR